MRRSRRMDGRLAGCFFPIPITRMNSIHVHFIFIQPHAHTKRHPYSIGSHNTNGIYDSDPSLPSSLHFLPKKRPEFIDIKSGRIYRCIYKFIYYSHNVCHASDPFVCIRRFFWLDPRRVCVQLKWATYLDVSIVRFSCATLIEHNIKQICCLFVCPSWGRTMLFSVQMRCMCSL